MKTNAMDVSYCQQSVDFTKAQDGGMTFAVIKATQGGNLDGTGAPFEDPMFRTHADNARAAKMPVGFYHFLTAASAAEAVKEADFFLHAVAGYHPAYVFLDCEVYGMPHLEALSAKALTDVCIAFLERCRAWGYIAALYTNPDHLKNRLDRRARDYPLWVALYGSKNPAYRNQLLWQHGVGAVPGVRGDCDLDLHAIPRDALAVMRLAQKGFLLSPAYWIGQLKTVRYLGTLLQNADAAFSYRWKQSSRADWACSYLQRCGVMQSPDFWTRQAEKHKNLATLLCNLGGGQR